MIVIGACSTAATRRPLETGTELSCWPKTTVAGTRTRARSAISTPWMPLESMRASASSVPSTRRGRRQRASSRGVDVHGIRRVGLADDLSQRPVPAQHDAEGARAVGIDDQVAQHARAVAARQRVAVDQDDAVGAARVGERLGGDHTRAQRVARQQRVLHADGPHEVIELPLPVGQEVVAAALGVAEPREVHGEHAVVAAEVARDRVPRVARLEEPADQHDRRALRPEALVVREHAARVDESPGRRQRAPGMLVRRRRGVVDGRAARDAERDAEHDDAGAFRDALGPEHGLNSNHEHSE